MVPVRMVPRPASRPAPRLAPESARRAVVPRPAEQCEHRLSEPGRAALRWRAGGRDAPAPPQLSFRPRLRLRDVPGPRLRVPRQPTRSAARRPRQPQPPLNQT